MIIRIRNKIKCKRNSFILLDDETEFPMLDELVNIIKRSERRLYLLKNNEEDLEYIHKNIQSMTINKNIILVGIGKGGQFLLHLYQKKYPNLNTIEYINFNQKIVKNKVNGYEYSLDINNYREKTLIIFEDVIATGSTIKFLKGLFNEINAKIMAVVTMVYYTKSESFDLPIIALNSVKMINELVLEPPLFSFRHLVKGEGNIFEFKNYLVQMYFHNNFEILNFLNKLYKID